MRFREVVLQALDPDALVAWYRDALGLRAAPGTPAGVVAGASILRFERAPAGVEPIYHFAFNVPEDRIEDALRWIRDRAPVIEEADGAIVDYASWNAHAVYFLDPAGNIGELIARHALQNASARPFDGDALLEVSEVGLPAPSVPELAQELRAALGIGDYRPARERFAPLGDERGLLILVPDGRPWYPTALPARPYPVRIVHDGPTYEARELPYRFLSA